MLILQQITSQILVGDLGLTRSAGAVVVEVPGLTGTRVAARQVLTVLTRAQTPVGVLCALVHVYNGQTRQRLYVILIEETQRRQYEGHNTPLGYYTDQGP